MSCSKVTYYVTKYAAKFASERTADRSTEYASDCATEKAAKSTAEYAASCSCSAAYFHVTMSHKLSPLQHIKNDTAYHATAYATSCSYLAPRLSDIFPRNV